MIEAIDTIAVFIVHNPFAFLMLTGFMALAISAHRNDDVEHRRPR